MPNKAVVSFLDILGFSAKVSKRCDYATWISA